MAQHDKKIIVIGAGLGGMSAAISLAAAGYSVEVFEKNAKVGGKLNLLQANGFTFDLGPSILTLPQVFEELFARAGKKFTEMVPVRPLDPQWRNFFEDGTTFDLFYDRDKMRAELRRFDPASEEGFFKFLHYSAQQYAVVERGYFQHGLDTVADFMHFYALRDTVQFDWLHTMHQSVARFVKHPKIVDVLDFFIKYVGSSAYAAPGFMNLLPTIQFNYQLWYVDGGLYHIAKAMQQVMNDLRVAVHLNAEVAQVLNDNGRVTGIRLLNGEQIAADYVVSNMETIPAYERLLGESPEFLKTLERFEPACSGLILDIGVNCRYPQLAHHNFFFSRHQKEHFASVFKHKTLPEDPTMYVVAASRTDPTVAPDGCEGIKILPHIPYINEQHPYTVEDYVRFKDRILDKLERMGLQDLKKNIIHEHMWTPLDIQQQYYSNKGSIYGVVSDRRKNFAFKTPKQSSKYPNLFFVGGSVNPGGGMPMVVLCGQRVCEKLIEVDQKGSSDV